MAFPGIAAVLPLGSATASGSGVWFWEPLGRQEWGGWPGEVSMGLLSASHPSKFHLCPVKCQLGEGELCQRNDGRESLGFRGGQEVAGDKGLSNDGHGGSGGRETSRGRGREQGEMKRKEDEGEAAAVTLETLRGSTDPAATSPSRGPHGKA